ncbi:MAG: DUF1775 domain-containing protein [Pseudorhodoplanes sp.]|nr:DUF1775 domain-containing protein [Pseudorhodoplanes sp.]
MMHRFMKKAAISLLALPCLAMAASAHVTLEVRDAKAGAPYKAVLRVPHGCDGTPTLKVKAQIPEGMIAVKPMPKAGWQLETVKGRYARTYAYYHGAQLSEGVKEIIWTGKLSDAHYDEFVFSGYVAAELPAGKLHVPVTQECEKGEARWSEIPAAGQHAHALKFPAPSLTILVQAVEKTPQNVKFGALTVEAPWIRATPGGAKVAGGYMKITNTGREPDRLVGGSMEAAGRFEVHEMAMDNGVMKMRHLAKGLEIKPGESVELKPGGYHLMFMDLKRGLKEGETAKGTLVFEKAGTIEVQYKVGPIGGGAPAAGGHSGH